MRPNAAANMHRAAAAAAVAAATAAAGGSGSSGGKAALQPNQNSMQKLSSRILGSVRDDPLDGLAGESVAV